jgi:hypothetical protein
VAHSEEPESIEPFADGVDPGIVREFFDFLRCSKKWWLIPLLLGLALTATIAVVSSSPIFPFIYTLF